jgi:hypothetical protein
MRKRIFIIALVVIIGCLGLVGVVILRQLTLSGGGGTTPVGETYVTYLLLNDRIALVVWTDNTGFSGHESESSLFSGASARGSFSSVDGKRIDWEWNAPKEKGGDFQLNGTPYDLANGTLFLVSTKGGQVRVTQLDVDLSKVQPNKEGFEALAKNDPKISQFIAEATGEK